MSNRLFLEVARRQSFRRRGGPVLIYVVVVAAVVCAGVSTYVAWRLANPPRKPIEVDRTSLGPDVREVAFGSTDGVRLKGWFIPSDAGVADRTVVFSHGYAGNRVGDEPAVPMARAAAADGFNALLFDFRNSGESGGALTTVGTDEVKDLRGAIRFLSDRTVWGDDVPGRGLALVGFSMGAVASLLAADAEPRVRAVVADSPFADLRSYLDENLTKWTHLPSFPFNWLIGRAVPALAGIDVSANRPVDVVSRWDDRPLLLIHGGDDDLIPISNSETLLRAAPGGADVALWRVPGAGHVGAYGEDPAGYRDRLSAVLNRAFPDGDG